MLILKHISSRHKVTERKDVWKAMSYVHTGRTVTLIMNIKQVYETGACSPGENVKLKSKYSFKKL